MKLFQRLFLLTVLSAPCFFAVQAQVIDQAKSHVSFEIGNMKINTVEGELKGMSGSLFFEPLSLKESFFNICINVKSMDTGSEKRDEHLLTADFFEAEVYPNICFVSEEIKQGNSEDFIAVGNLKMKDVERKVEIAFTYNEAAKQFIGKLIINRLDFKVGEDTGTFMVSDEVEITIYCSLQ